MAEGDSEYAVRTSLNEPLRCSLYKCKVQVVPTTYYLLGSSNRLRIYINKGVLAPAEVSVTD